jgi:hypothetical protein
MKSFLKWLFGAREEVQPLYLDMSSYAAKSEGEGSEDEGPKEKSKRFVYGKYGFLDMETGNILSAIPNNVATKITDVNYLDRSELPRGLRAFRFIYLGYIGGDA